MSSIDSVCVLLQKGSTVSWTHYLRHQIHFGPLRDLHFVLTERVGIPSHRVQKQSCGKHRRKHVSGHKSILNRDPVWVNKLSKNRFWGILWTSGTQLGDWGSRQQIFESKLSRFGIQIDSIWELQVAAGDQQERERERCPCTHICTHTYIIYIYTHIYMHIFF